MNAIIVSVHIIVSFLLIGLILIQHGKGADAGASSLSGGGTSSSLFGSQGSASLLSKISAIIAIIFFVTSLTLAYFFGKIDRAESVVQSVSQSSIKSAEAIPKDLPKLP
ncbi:MAG: preprotein translocase subunit SecG [Piscirickettsiaceae bacterium]|nr:preprotein translocase subunit SecG [Piscirickettsiaceae bacterium]